MYLFLIQKTYFNNQVFQEKLKMLFYILYEIPIHHRQYHFMFSNFNYNYRVPM